MAKKKTKNRNGGKMHVRTPQMLMVHEQSAGACNA
jgi:hypothetical protein